MFVLMPSFVINQAAQPIIGFNHGAKKYKRVKRTLYRAIGVATLICLSGFLVVMFFPDTIISIFSKNNPELEVIGVEGLRLFLLMLPLIGFQVVSTSFFQATGKPAIAMFLTLSRQVIFLLPLVLILPNFFGLRGIWISAPIADVAATLLTLIFLRREMKKLDQLMV